MCDQVRSADRPERAGGRPIKVRLVTPLSGADTARLREFAAAVLDLRDGFMDVTLYTQQAGELAAAGESAALYRGQAIAYRNAAEHIDEAMAIASGRWEMPGAPICQDGQ
jgi:hypothetical protein